MSTRDSDGTRSATDSALRLLARRPLTEKELRARLEGAGHGGAEVDAACERLRAAGYLDDRRLAADFIVTRAERLGHGPEKLVAALCERGVDRETAESALELAVERGDLNPDEVLQRRMRRHVRGAKTPLAPREYARVYNALRRAGFAEDAIREALDPWREPPSHAEPTADEATDDFP